MIVSRSALRIMRNVSDKRCRENQNTPLVFNNSFLPENRAVYEIMWINMIEPDRPQMAIRRMRIAYCLTKATNTHSEYVILIAFPIQHWLNERAPIFRLYVHWLTLLTSARLVLKNKNRSGIYMVILRYAIL